VPKINLFDQYTRSQLSQQIINLFGIDPGMTETPTPANRILTQFQLISFSGLFIT